MELKSTDGWKREHPGAVVGMLVMRGIAPGSGAGEVSRLRERVEAELRERFSTIDALRQDPILAAYKRYYARFGKTYHVAQQVESVALKAKPIPTVIPLVTATFAVELKDLLLTAIHDLSAIVPPFEVGTACGEERCTTMRGEERSLRKGDMFIADARGVISSITVGPDGGSRVSGETGAAVFFVYAPDGIGEQRVLAHLDNLRDSVLSFSPGSAVETVTIVRAG